MDHLSRALRVTANFKRVRTGRNFRRVAVLVVVAVIAAFLMTSVVSHTVFSAVGEPLEGRKGSYIVALLVTLSISGAGLGVRLVIPRKLKNVAFALSGVASAALLAFYYGGMAADENPQVALASAVVGGLLMGFISLKVRTGVVAVGVAIASAIAAYGLAFWFWAVAIAFWSAQKLIWGIVFSTLSLAYIALIISSMSLVIKEIQKVNKPL